MVFLCASVGLAIHGGKEQRASKDHCTVWRRRQRNGAEGEGRRGQEGIQNRKSRLKASAGERARPLKIPPRMPQGKKKIQMEGRLQPILPPSLATSFCGRLRPILSFLRAFPSFIRNGPFHSEREQDWMSLAQATRFLPGYTDDARWGEVKHDMTLTMGRPCEITLSFPLSG